MANGSVQIFITHIASVFNLWMLHAMMYVPLMDTFTNICAVHHFAMKGIFPLHPLFDPELRNSKLKFYIMKVYIVVVGVKVVELSFNTNSDTDN